MCASYGNCWRARGDRSPRATPRRPLRSLYIQEHAARGRVLGGHYSWFSLALRLSFETRSYICQNIGHTDVFVIASLQSVTLGFWVQQSVYSVLRIQYTVLTYRLFFPPSLRCYALSCCIRYSDRYPFPCALTHSSLFF